MERTMKNSKNLNGKCASWSLFGFTNSQYSHGWKNVTVSLVTVIEITAALRLSVKLFALLECYNSPWTEPVDWKVWLYQCCNPSWLHGIVSYQCILSPHSFIMCKNGIDIVVRGFARCEGIHSLSSSVAKWAAVCIDGAWTEKVGPLETMQRVWRQ